MAQVDDESQTTNASKNTLSLLEEADLKVRASKVIKSSRITEAIDITANYITSTDDLYPIRILGLRADWATAGGIAAVIGSALGILLRSVA